MHAARLLEAPRELSPLSDRGKISVPRRRYGDCGAHLRLMAKPPDPPRRPNPAARSHRERSERQAVFPQSVLVFLDQQRLQVAVKSLSETGARVKYFTRMELPKR
jgi:hypothetical protein